MVGAVSFNPYVSSYQYTGGYARMRASAQNMQVQAGQGASAAAGGRAVSTGRSGGVSSLIGARSIASAGQAAGVAAVSAGRGADPESPVQPVDAISALKPTNSGSTNYSIPFLRAGMDPAELAVRMRIQYTDGGASGQAQSGNARGADGEAAQEAVQMDLPGMKSGEEAQTAVSGQAAQAGLPGTNSAEDSEAKAPGTASEKDAPKIAGMGNAEKTMEETECKTCKERKYQDGSNDPGVSFKTPGHIAPEQSASAVRGHELEHVVRERAKAQSEGRRVVSQSVTMQTGICPECGRVYVAGGTTRTTTAAESKPEEKPKDPRWILASAA